MPSQLNQQIKGQVYKPNKIIKAGTGIEQNTYRRMYPTGAGSSKFCGLPKILKISDSARHFQQGHCNLWCGKRTGRNV